MNLNIYSLLFFHQKCVNVCNIINIDAIVVNRKIVNELIEPSLFHVIDCEILPRHNSYGFILEFFLIN